VRTSYARTHDRRYIRGTFWNQGWASATFNTEPGKAVLQRPYILFTNIHLETGAPLAPILRQVHEAGQGERGLVVIAPVILQDAINLLAANKTRDILPTLAIKAPGLGSEKDEILRDLAALCGGRVIFRQTGESLEQVTLADLGQADEVQAIRSGFTVIGGKGRPAIIRDRVQELRKQMPEAAYGRERDRLGERAGKLLGGVALLEIGGATDSERDYLKNRAQEAVRVVRLGMQDGVVPGGGVAYLRCLSALDDLVLPPAEAAAIPILRRALAAPMTAILANSGLDPAPILNAVQQSENGRGYDVLRERYVDVLEDNIIDPLRVTQTALRTGVSGALMALTTEVLVHKPRGNRSDEVDFTP
jgi:chaperonin GroEL